MSLLRLPPETLEEIFDYVGTSFFHQDLRCLTVCKRWFQFALPASLRSIRLSETSLRALVFSWDNSKPFPLIDHLQTLDIELMGYQGHYQDEDLTAPAAPTAPIRSGTRHELTPENWTQELDDDLAHLAVILQQSRKLRDLRIHSVHSPHPPPLESMLEYLSLPTIRSFLSMNNLTVLILDLSVSLTMPLGDQENNDIHICPAVGALLNTLKTLHIRMRSICPGVLKPQNVRDKLRLSEVVINLSLIENLPWRTTAAHSARCFSGDGGLPQLKSDLLEHAKVLTHQMTYPKALRILTHSLPGFEIHSLDVLSGTTTTLDDGMPWNQDGRPIEEGSEPESEITGSDFSSDSE